MSSYERPLRELQEVAAPGAHVVDAAHTETLSVTVVFTTVVATLEALREAGRLASHLGAPVRVLVPCVVPYPLDLTRPRVDPLFRLRHFRTVCDRHSVETSLDVRLCRDKLRCILDALAPRSLVLVGGYRSFWPWTCENLLTQELRDKGHDVIFVETKK